MNASTSKRRGIFVALLEDHPVIIGLAIRLILMFALPALMDDGLLLQGVRYTDIDYDVFTDAAFHAAHGRSPYARHTYRYTPFLAKLLALPLEYGSDGGSGGLWGAVFSMRYFGKIIFCIADVICGYIIVVLRRKKRITSGANNQHVNNGDKRGWKNIIDLSPELKDALWWLYNPLPINICTRGSAESLVVLLPVLATVAIADMYQSRPSLETRWRGGTLQIMARACFAGIIHGIGIHAKLYPVIYTISFMANFSRQQQQREMLARKGSKKQNSKDDVGWRYLLSEQMQFIGRCFCCDDPSKSEGISTFPWKHPMQILVLAMFWVQRLLFTMSSILFLVVSLGTVGILTYLAVYYYGQEALDEGLLYHFQRVDHRHNYSMYWYWIYLARGRAEIALSQLAEKAAENASISASAWGYIPLIPQVLILGFSSLGIAPYDLSFALFCQTFAFVAFNKVITAQYFTWYLCLLPLCSDSVDWKSKDMYLSLGMLIVSIITWLLSAFSLEMLGWKSHRQVWMASLFFFIANVNLLRSIVNGYKKSKREAQPLSQPGEGWAVKLKES
mmetsp:Transcript_31928/g.67125  ORF Transcript_31928/g.67125 Transcript_31928/m.67125 type:complete len:560 (+) Transcript_31928:88-1767(+)